MKTILLVWNANRFCWKGYEDDVLEVAKSGSLRCKWSCGTSKKIEKDDRFFFIRLGQIPRGIVGAGYVSSEPKPGPHWDKTPGKKTNYVEVDFDTLTSIKSKVAAIPIETLQKRPFSAQHWVARSSGITIQPKVARPLEELWAKATKRPRYRAADELSPEGRLPEGAVREVTVNAYERNPAARAKCIAHYGAFCAVCRIDFFETYGKIGKYFIHVHHIRPLSKLRRTYRVNPIADLRPVCPNCHAMLHKKDPPLSIARLRERFRGFKRQPRGTRGRG